jgi:nucleoside-diphosphate-sugar epimerase
MRVFVTGASGWIGSAVVPELLDAGHQVTGLARSDASAAALTAAGVQVQHGTLDDLDTLRSIAAASDGVIHLAFKHDLAFTGDFQGAADADRAAVEAFGEALAGSGKPFLIASGTLGIAPGRVATEQDGHGDGSGTAAWGSGPETRRATAELTLSFADRGVRSSVVRLPPPPGPPSPATRASPVTSATGPTAGPRCTGSIPRTCSASPWKTPRPDRRCTPWPTRGCRSAPSPR